ncbi:unnamed protein product [Adineta steineri]|uniref:MAM domain-containing protein n=1 Tax=Adineta steineri TaxID=433720 RepID=A0A814RDW8_9BILA|nr:unnamed protein product [Adineta steineri]CAF3974717.1 unnamed protein product [Adineta steineri]
MSLFLISIIIFIVTVNQISSNELFYQCTLDKNDLCRLNSFDGGKEMIIDSGYNLSISSKPNQPLSDVSSILKPTKNGSKCQIPYKNELISDDDLYFCSNSLNEMTCLTINGYHDQCQQGKYHLLLLENVEQREFISPNIINASEDITCLTFYYYLTKANVVLLLTDYINEQGQRKLISGFTDVSINGWNLARAEFKPNSTSYRIIFRIFRADMTILSEPFYVAIDQISLTKGICGTTLPPFQDLEDNETFSSAEMIDETTSNLTTIDETISTDSSSITTEIFNPITSTSYLHSSSITTTTTTTTNKYSSEYIETATNETDTIGEVTSSNETFSITYSFTQQTTNDQFINNITTSTQYPDITTTTEKSPFQYSLGTILGLSIGLGIPAALGIILTLIFIIKLIKKKSSKIIPTNNIPLKKHHREHRQHRQHREHRHHRHGKKTKKKRDELF